MGMRSWPQQLEGSDPPSAPVMWARVGSFPLSRVLGEARAALTPTPAVASRPAPTWHQAGCAFVFLTRMQTCWTGLARRQCQPQAQAHLRVLPLNLVWGRLWYNPACLGSQHHSASTVECQELLVGRPPRAPPEGVPSPVGSAVGGTSSCCPGSWRG